jgi:predicted DCC family thiol-disulfide oxidoreductase YuxK
VIVVFDALCPLCSANARFLLKRDGARVFRLASVQSEAGRALYRRFGLDADDPDTMLVVDGDRLLRDSDAVLAIARGLGAPWSGAVMFRLVPRRLRDAAYRWVARNRYRLFGRRDTCWLPTAEYRDRLL